MSDSIPTSFDRTTIERIAKAAAWTAAVCIVLFSLTAVNTHGCGDQATWLFPFLPATWQFFFQVAPALVIAMIASLMIGGLAGIVLSITPNTNANKQGVDKVAEAAPSFILGIGTAGFAQAVTYLAEEAKNFGINTTISPTATKIVLLSGVAFFVIFGLFLGIAYQTKAPPNSGMPTPQPDSSQAATDNSAAQISLP